MVGHINIRGGDYNGKATKPNSIWYKHSTG